ncbi:MAG: hypothetical protein V3V99_07215 [candidate division Zixibacteria bacterium]
MRQFSDLISKPKDYITNPKNRLELLLVNSFVLIAYFYLFTFQDILGISVPLVSFATLIAIPSLSLVGIPLIKVIYISPDKLQRGVGKKKAIRFFQNEFPSNYLITRCQICNEDINTCHNFITKESYDHIRIWFNDIFHGAIMENYPKAVHQTYKKGYTCKLLFHLCGILLFFTVVSVCTYTFYIVTNYHDLEFAVFDYSYQIFYMLSCPSIYGYIKFTNKVNTDNPTGCWHAWREINRIHTSWMKKNDKILNNIICIANGNGKVYQKRK